MTLGAISAYYKQKKQIYIFFCDKLPLINDTLDDLSFYKHQIDVAEKETLSSFKRDLDSLIDDHKWPLEVRVQVLRLKIKHSFLYEDNTFLRTLYAWLKKVDALNA